MNSTYASYSQFKDLISEKAQNYCEENNVHFMCENFISWCCKNSIDDLYQLLLSNNLYGCYSLTYIAEYYGVNNKDYVKTKTALLPLLKHKDSVVVEGALSGLYDLALEDIEVKNEIKKIFPHQNKAVNNLIYEILSRNLNVFK